MHTGRHIISTLSRSVLPAERNTETGWPCPRSGQFGFGPGLPGSSRCPPPASPGRVQGEETHTSWVASARTLILRDQGPASGPYYFCRDPSPSTATLGDEGFKLRDGGKGRDHTHPVCETSKFLLNFAHVQNPTDIPHVALSG